MAELGVFGGIRPRKHPILPSDSRPLGGGLGWGERPRLRSAELPAHENANFLRNFQDLCLRQTQHAAQDVVQDATVTVVFDFDGGVQPGNHLESQGTAIRPGKAHRYQALGLDRIV
jgi:hypothetical protein